MEGWRGSRDQGSSARSLSWFLMTISQESPLPHSARTIAFLNSEVVCLAYEADYVLFSLNSMSIIEIYSAPTTTKSGAGIGNVGMSAFTGLGGYMTLGLGSKLRPCLTNVGDENVLIVKDSMYVAPSNWLSLITLQTTVSSSVLTASRRASRVYPGQHLQRMSVRRVNLRSCTGNQHFLVRLRQAIHFCNTSCRERAQRRRRIGAWPADLLLESRAPDTLFDFSPIIPVIATSVQFSSICIASRPN